MKTLFTQSAMVMMLVGLTACETTTYTTRPGPGPRANNSKYVDPGETSNSSTLRTESNDIVAMCDKMVRSILANPAVSARKTPPRIVLDSAYFKNRSSDRLDVRMITDRMRTALVKSANGRMFFLARHAVDAVEKERALKRDGTVDGGTVGQTQRTAGADYRLVGTITERSNFANTGTQSSFMQFTFELIDLETSAIVWANDFDFKKVGRDSGVYR